MIVENIEIVTILIFLVLMVLLATGLPVAFCMLAIAVIGYFILIRPTVPIVFYSAVFNMSLLDIFIAAPLFIFMAALLESSGVAAALYETMFKWSSGLKGGLAMGSIGICAIIAAMSGLSATGTLTVGLMAYPEMRKRGYNKMISVGSVTFGGTLGPIIPPSLTMIIVGSFANLSVGKLFIGGIIPGFLLAFCGMAYVAFRCWRNPTWGPGLPPEERPGWREKSASLRGVILPVLLIILVLGSIYGGICTPSEAAAVGAFGTIICAIIYRKFTWPRLKKAGLTTLRMTSMLMFVVMCGATFASFCSVTGVSHFIREIMTGLDVAPMVIVVIMLFITFILGMFIDAAAIIIISLPLFMPVVLELGVDPLWFAVEYTIMIVCGFLTPPFGMNLFYFKGLGFPEVSMMDIYRSVLPFIAISFILIVLYVFVPELITWLPGQMITR